MQLIKQESLHAMVAVAAGDICCGHTALTSLTQWWVHKEIHFKQAHYVNFGLFDCYSIVWS
jgi:hypothetical protein